MRTTLCLLTVVVIGLAAQTVYAHCEVPCGIYDDQLRFQSMLEDQATIEKASSKIGELADKHGAHDLNQLVRWVNTKEDHASKIQHKIAQYFMTQRIKADDEKYAKKLAAAHAVLVAAMQSKQAASPESTAALKKSILDFYRAYEGKEPAVHE